MIGPTATCRKCKAVWDTWSLTGSVCPKCGVKLKRKEIKKIDKIHNRTALNCLLNLNARGGKNKRRKTSG